MSETTTRRTAVVIAGAAIALSISVVIATALGTLTVPLGETLSAIARGLSGQAESLEGIARVVWTVRFPRVLIAVLVGASLGASGAATQAVFRNPLADPYLLGVASGAALGAVLGWRASAESAATDLAMVGTAAPGSIVPVSAFAGGLGAVLITSLLAMPARGTRSESLILAGVVVSSMLTAITTFLLLFDEGEHLRAVIAWTLGNLALASWDHVARLAPYCAVAITLLIAIGRALDALQLGDDTARTLGVPVEATKWLALGAATLATSASIAFVGVVGFVGLIAPHLMRRIGRPSHRTLIVTSSIAGATLLVLGDLGARTVARPAEIPVGIMLTLVGGPVFLWLLRRT